MLRITRVEGENSMPTLKLEGKLLEPWIAELQRVSTPANGSEGRGSLDLSGLTYVDQAGSRALKGLLDRGYTVSACSRFVAELLHLESS
jgi:hypothetical protein